VNCPRCRTWLAADTLDAGGVAVEAKSCEKCTGHWIALGDLKTVESVVDLRFLRWRNLPGMETQGRILLCPECPEAMPMEKIVSLRDQRVVMDVCHHCQHVWLDRGELEAIQQRGLLGGLQEIIKALRDASR